MRIAVVTPFLDRRHGTERALAEQIERLAERYGCEVHLYAQQVADVEVEKPGDSKGSRRRAILWHKVPSLPGPHLIQFLAWMFLNAAARRRSKRAGLRFDLVFSAGINCLDADAVLIHALFHRLREVSGEEIDQGRKAGGLLRRLHRRAYYGVLSFLERRVYSDAKVSLAAVSQRTVDLVAQYFHRQATTIVPNGVDTVQFCPAARASRRCQARSNRNFGDKDFVLLLIGNDWRVKGLPVILAAMAAAGDLPLRLVVVGEDDAAPFQELARRLGVTDRCRWEGPRAEVIDLYAAADAYVSPTKEDSFGLPVLEAMACGLPVITSACAGVSGLIRDGVDGFVLADPADVEALSGLVRQLRNDGSLRRDIGAAATESAKQWTWDRSADALWECLKDAAARKAARISAEN